MKAHQCLCQDQGHVWAMWAMRQGWEVRRACEKLLSICLLGLWKTDWEVGVRTGLWQWQQSVGGPEMR